MLFFVVGAQLVMGCVWVLEVDVGEKNCCILFFFSPFSRERKIKQNILFSFFIFNGMG